MIIRFKLGQFDDIYEEHWRVFEQGEPIETEEQGNDALVVSAYRIVIPQIGASFRYGDWYARNPEADDPESDDAWEPQASVYVRYAENETDANKYLSFAACSLEWFIYQIKSEALTCEEIDNMECYIDTKEFFDEE